MAKINVSFIRSNGYIFNAKGMAQKYILYYLNLPFTINRFQITLT